MSKELTKRVIIAIDPGSPNKRDVSATTGVFVGEYWETKMIETKSFEIYTDNQQMDENDCAKGIAELYHKYVNQGYVVDVVIEEFITYAYNMQANAFGKNDTSELIGKIKLSVPVPIKEQSTSDIKTRYNDKILLGLNILKKEGKNYKWSSEFGNNETSNRHERDAARHYLLYRDKQGLFNYIGNPFDLF